MKQTQSNFASIQCKKAIKVTQIFNFSKFKVQSLDIANLLGAEGPQQGPQGPKGPEGPPVLGRSQKDGLIVPRSSSLIIFIKFTVIYTMHYLIFYSEVNHILKCILYHILYCKFISCKDIYDIFSDILQNVLYIVLYIGLYNTFNSILLSPQKYSSYY